MKPVFLLLCVCLLDGLARADFQYVTRTTSSGGMMAAVTGGPGKAATKPAGDATRLLYQGDKVKIDSGTTAMIIDLGVQTLTSIDHGRKTYNVTPLGSVPAGAKNAKLEMKMDVKETDQRKTINGYAARQVIITMDLESPQTQGAKMRLTSEMWLSEDVDGAQELRAFYQRNGDRFPWQAMFGKTDPAMGKSLADFQKKVAALGGVPVLQIMRMSMAGDPARAAELEQQVAAARRQLEDMKKQGGDQAAAATQALAALGSQGSQPGVLMEMTMESSDFSTKPIPASEFAIPADYRKVSQ